MTEPLPCTNEPAARGRPKHLLPTHPPCLNCDGPVPRAEKDSKSTWLRRLCCCPKCAGEHANAEKRLVTVVRTAALEAAHGVCVICADPVLRRTGEHEEKYIGRATCGKPICVNAYRKRRQQEIAALAAAGDPPVGEISNVDYHGGFARHNLRFKPMPGTVHKPYTRSFGVSSSWAVRGG